MLTDAGMIILKYYLDISKKEQKDRLKDREKDPLKQWKVSPVDIVAQKHWKDYSKTRNSMLLKTNFKHAPWFVVNAEKEKDSSLQLSHILRRLKYRNKNEKILSSENELVYLATSDNIKNKLF